MQEIEIKEFRQLDAAVLGDILNIEDILFGAEAYGAAKIEKQASRSTDLVILMAYVVGKVAGYKIGYGKTERLFYSWLGGVLPDFRRRGIAGALMRRQHEIAKQLNYQAVQTHTENRFRDMLVLNIRTGFDVIGTFYSTRDKANRIILEKQL